jgi:hypothetical protein
LPWSGKTTVKATYNYCDAHIKGSICFPADPPPRGVIFSSKHSGSHSRCFVQSAALKPVEPL